MNEPAEILALGSDEEFRRSVAARIVALENAHADLIRKLGYEDYQRRLFAMTQHHHKATEIDDLYGEVAKLFST